MTALAALALAVALSGCAGGDFDKNRWFSKPLNLFGNNLGYSYSQLGEQKQQRPITANDLVDANGACPRRAPAPAPSVPGSPRGNSAAASEEAAAQLAGGVGIGMSECDVVTRLGTPSAVSLARNQNGDRTAVLTFNGGPRPGIYRFAAGRLDEMDRVAALPAPPAAKKVKKKPAKGKRRRKQHHDG